MSCIRVKDYTMSEKLVVTTTKEWVDLPEIPLETISSPTQRGTVLQVLKAGFLLATPEECKKFRIQGAVARRGRYLLPTIVVETANRRKVLYRLPVALTEWAEACVAAAHVLHTNPFPANVEFGILNGRAYAEEL
jgi:hypothetical protein